MQINSYDKLYESSFEIFDVSSRFDVKLRKDFQFLQCSRSPVDRSPVEVTGKVTVNC